MIYIVSPHIDDAILSIGGLIRTLLKRKEQISIQYVFTISNWTNKEAIYRKKYPSNVEFVTKMRKQEEEKIALQLGYNFEFLDFYDFPLRSANQADLVQRIATTLQKESVDKNVHFFPLAMGQRHPDHDIVHQVARKLNAQGYPIYYYEDLPYSARNCHDHNKTGKVMTAMGYCPKAFEIDISLKESILKHYKSQVSEEWLGCIKSYSYNLKNNKYYERIWIPADSKSTIRCLSASGRTKKLG